MRQGIPAFFAIGDTVDWEDAFADADGADYAAQGYALSYVFVKSGLQKTVSGSIVSGVYNTTITAAVSATFTAGTYSYQAYVTSGSIRRCVASGTIEARANFSTQTSGYDFRSHAQKMVDAIEALIEGRATKDQEQLTHGSVSISKIPFPELIRIRDLYKAELSLDAEKARSEYDNIDRSIIYGRFSND